MNYEEKYNKALKRARYYHSKDYMLINSAIENIFPELKESEDERIRKDIISYLRNEKNVKRYISDIEIDKWIAWLEKQGFSKEQTNLPCFTFDDVLALECCMETVKKVQEDEELYGKLNDLHSKVYDAYQLEKQGEMKSTEDTKKLDADKVIA